MQVVRLERDFLNVPGRFNRIVALITYGPTAIGEWRFWMPQSIRAEFTERDSKKTGIFAAEYSNCKKFIAETLP
jgi:hypothetical protein